MNVAAISRPRELAGTGLFRSDGVVFLQVFAVLVMVFPSDMIIKPIGAAGYPASLFGVCVLGVFCASVLLGLHDPSRHAHPMRGVLAVVWAALLTSYILMDPARLTGVQLLSADRTLIRYAVVTGAALVAAEWLRSLQDVMRVVRVLCWGAAFCGFVAVLQYWLSLDLAQYLRQVPGFTLNHDNPAIQIRGSLNRVAGTATHAIELGVVMGMLIPVAFCLGLYDRDRSAFKRWAPVSVMTLGAASSVSRSAIVSVVVAFTVMVVLLPPVPRMAALSVVPIALAVIFVSAHGLIGTLASFFAGARNDPSVMYRTHDYPVAEALWQSKPWFGQGPGTWLPADSIDIFDNEYLDTVVQLGGVGIVALLSFFLSPAIVALIARRRSSDPELRLLCAGLAGAGFSATVSPVTWDAMSFPMFVNVHALMIGLAGACWRLAPARREMIPTAGLGSGVPEVQRQSRFWPGRAES